MITVEELIIQSLYHKLVLVNVKRTPFATAASGGKLDGLGLLITGAQAMRSAMASQGKLPQMITSSGENHDTDIEDDTGQTESSDKVQVRAGTNVKVAPELETILDTGEFKLVKTKSIEVQTDLPPMWYFNYEDNQMASSTRRISAASPFEHSQEQQVRTCQQEISVNGTSANGCGGVDLSKYNEFSIVHYQDLRDPENRSMVMIQTAESGRLVKANELPGYAEDKLTYKEREMIEAAGNYTSTDAQKKLFTSLSQKSFDTALSDGTPTAAAQMDFFKSVTQNSQNRGFREAALAHAELEIRRTFSQQSEDSDATEVASVIAGSVSGDNTFPLYETEINQLCDDLSAMDQEIDSGIFDVRSGPEHVPLSPTTLRSMKMTRQQPHDEEPTMSFRKFQIEDEVILQGDSAGIETAPRVEQIMDTKNKKELPFTTSTPKKKKVPTATLR